MAHTGKMSNIEDAYKEEGFDFSGTKAADKNNNYRSKSFLTLPLKNHEDEIVGVMQLINAIDRETGNINLHKALKIVQVPENFDTEISLENAIKKEKKETIKIGDEIFEQ